MFGVLKYDAKDGRNKNIGDYIQSLAAMQFTGPDVVLVEREHLHEYDGAPLRMILNAYYMHHPQNWPPSNQIEPLLISIHINPHKAEEMLSDKGIEYFKRYEPIGCRDKGTEEILRLRGIETYFSGCLTLTLGNSFQHNPTEGKICFVDPFYRRPRGRTLKSALRCAAFLFKNVGHLSTIIRIAKRLQGSVSPQAILSTAVFYNAYRSSFSDHLLENAEYVTHNVSEADFPTEMEKFSFAKNLVAKYSQCELVVTSRIHAALPCLGIETPVIFVTDDHFQRKPSSQGRFEGILDLLNVLRYSDDGLDAYGNFHIESKISRGSQVVNKRAFLPLAESMTRACLEFARKSG